MNPKFKLKALVLPCLTVMNAFWSLSTLADATPVESDTVELDTVVVVGQADAFDRAINQQKDSDNLITIMTANDIGEFPDSNASESLQRMVGLSIERDQGEGRFVRVRGLGPDFNAVTINGVRVPSPENDVRAVALDVVPSDLLGSLEVVKVLTPDMDADSLGGAVNLKTLSAFDKDGEFYKGHVEVGYDENVSEYSPAISGVYTNIFSFDGRQDRLGIALSASYQNRSFGSDNTETGGDWSIEDGVAQLEAFEARDYDIERERIGLAANFDWELNTNTQLFLRTLHSQFADDEIRNAAIFEFEENEDGSEFPTNGSREHEVEIERELKARKETQQVQSIMVGGEHRWDNWQTEFVLSHSHAEEDQPNAISGAVFKSDAFSDAGFNNTREPTIAVSDAYLDSDNYELDEIEVEDSFTEDNESAVKVDLTRSLIHKGNAWDLSTGLKLSRREKSNQNTTWVVDEFGDHSDSLSDYDGSSVDYDLGSFGPSINPGSIRDVVNSSDLDEFVDDEESIINDYTIDEDIDATYLQARGEIGNWTTIFGLRYEKTSTLASGFEYIKSEEGDDIVNRRRIGKDYEHVLPSAQVKFSPTNNIVWRAAYTNSIVRPNFEQLSPGLIIEDDEAEAGNPLLKALESQNLDVSFEYYMDDFGAVSVALFHKNIDNFIYESVTEFDDDVAAALGYEELSGFANGEEATLKGLEFNYLQRLPGALNNMFFSTNFTLTDSEAELAERTIPLPNQSDLTANVALTYENHAMSLRLSSVYKSEYLLEVGDEKAEDVYESDHSQIDFIGKYYLGDRYVISFKALNLTDEPYYTYTGKESLNHQYESYGRTFQLGFSIVNF